MLEPASQDWHVEAVTRRDRQVNAVAMQLTSAPLIHHLPAPGAQAFTPDSTGLVYFRRLAPDLPPELWLADLETASLRRLTDESGVCGPAVSPDGRYLYYLAAGEGCELRRVCLQTYRREVVARRTALLRPHAAATLRADGDAYVASGPLPGGAFGLFRFDVPTGDVTLVWQSPEACRPRPQYRPGGGNLLLVQVNHGCAFDEQGRCLAVSAGYGVGLYTLRDDGSGLSPVPAGRSDVEMLQGRHGWAGNTGLVAATLLRRDRPDQAFTSDSLVWVDPESGDRELVGSGQAFAHPSACADGRWWACDVLGTGDVYVGSAMTGRYQAIARGAASFGTPGYTHPHPILSPDARWLAYNSDASGIAQICVVETGELRNHLRRA
jgi:hypothetical protein